MRGRDTSHSDEDLVRLYQADGRLDWLSTLYLRYSSLVYGVCLKYLKDREEAQDAVMQIFERLVTTLPHHKVDRFRSWLYVLARNHCLMQLRQHRNRPFNELTPLLMENGVPEHPEQEIMLHQDSQKLEKCLQLLARPQQQCIMLFFFEEKCYKDISQVTGYDYKQVKSNIQNGKRNLRICMEGHG